MQVDERFAEWFRALTGNPPLAWQRRLFARLAESDIPARLTLPTGLGKTSVIPIWLIALAQSASDAKRAWWPLTSGERWKGAS